MQLPENLYALRIRTMQILAGAILFGLVIFSAIAVVIVAQNGGPMGEGRDPEALPIVTIVAAAMFATCFIAGLVIVGPLLRSAVQRIAATRADADTTDDSSVGGDAAQLLAARQTALIVSCALFEAPGFAAAIAYLIEAQPFALLIMLGVVVGLVLQFPTHERVRSWLEHHLALVAELRQLGGPYPPS